MNINKINPYILNNNLSGYSSQKVKPYILTPRLPSEYQEVEYLENTSRCFIQTTIVPTVNTNCEVDFQVATDDNNCNVIMGSSDTVNGAPGYIIGVDTWRSNRNLWIRICEQVGHHIYIDPYSQQRLKIKYDNKKLFINDTEQSLIQSPDLTSSLLNNPMAIFIRRQAGGYYPSSGNAKLGKLYSCKFWGDVAADFIPCYRKADNKPGMYDLVNGVFYTNANQSASQDFIVGNTVARYIPQKAKINILYNSGRLPSEYQEVEYLESTGEQYIDTGLPTDYNYKIKITAETDTTNDSHCWLIGARIRIATPPWSENGISILHYNGIARFDFGDFTNTGEKTIPTGKVTFQIDNIGGYCNDTEMMSFVGATFTSSELTGNMLLGAMNDTGICPGVLKPYVGKIYSAIIYNINTLIRNFIPCYRKADNKPGLYDTVNDIFYVNANTSASQDFIVGPNIN